MPFASASDFIHADTRIFGSDFGIFYRSATTGKLLFLQAGTGRSNSYLAVNASGIPEWVAAPTFTLADNAVTLAKLQDFTSGVLLGRFTAGNGDPELLTPTQGRSILGLGTAALLNTGTAAGDIAVLGAGGVFPASVIPVIRSHEFVQVANTAARLALTTSQVQIGDEAFETDTLRTFKLVASDPSLAGSWVLVSDAQISGDEITVGTIAVAVIGTGTKDATTVYHGDGVFRPPASGVMPLTTVTTGNTAMAARNRYYANGASRLTFALPTTAAAGESIELTDIQGNGWRVTQAASQRIYMPTGESTTVGAGGYIENPIGDGTTTPLSKFCNVVLECIAANTWLLKQQNSIVTYA